MIKSSTKEIKRGSVLSALNTILGIFNTVLITPFIFDAIGDEAYGVYGVTSTIISCIYLLNFGLNSSMGRFITKFRASDDKDGESKFMGMSTVIFVFISFVALAAGAVFYILFDNIFANFSSDNIELGRRMLTILVFNAAFSMANQANPAAMYAYERFTFLHGWSLMITLISPLIKLALLYCTHLGVMTIIVVDVTTNVIYQFIIFFYCRYKLHIKYKFKGIDLNILREFFSYSFFIFLGVLVDILYWQIDKLIVGAVIDEKASSVITFGNHFPDYFIKIATMLSGMMMMRVMTLVVNNATGKQLTAAMSKLGRIQFLILGLILVGYIAIGRQFLNYYIPSMSDSGKNSVFTIGLILLIILLIPEIEILGLTILQAKNMHRFRSVTYLCIAILNVALTIPATKRFGVLGATYATAFSLILGQWIIMNIYYKKKVGIDIKAFFKDTCHGIFPALCISLVAGGLTFFIPQTSLLTLCIRCAIVVTVYCVSQWLIGMNEFEKDIIKELFKKLKFKNLSSEKEKI